jgi:Cu/Ag efflux pump CusA
MRLLRRYRVGLVLLSNARPSAASRSRRSGPLMLVDMVMASQFKSLEDPLIIMFSVPLGTIGVIWALFLANTTLNIASFMGIIMI